MQSPVVGRDTVRAFCLLGCLCVCLLDVCTFGWLIVCLCLFVCVVVCLLLSLFVRWFSVSFSSASASAN